MTKNQKPMTRDEAFDFIAYEVGAERNPIPGRVREAIRLRLIERREAITMLRNVCNALGIDTPEHQRFDGGSGLAGGSAFEHQQQDAWDEKIRAAVRAAGRCK